MNSFRSSLILFAAVALSACATGYNTVTETSVQSPARPAGCSFDVLTVVPSVSYQELGKVELSDGVPAGNQADFVKAVQSKVCAMGGDAIIAKVNDRGFFLGGTVLLTANISARSAEDAQLSAQNKNAQASEMAQEQKVAEKAQGPQPSAVTWVCKPEEDPRWASASAIEKKQLTDACMKPASTTPSAPAASAQ
jgi:hypothetical protein